MDSNNKFEKVTETCDWNLFGSLFLHTESKFFDRFTDFICEIPLVSEKIQDQESLIEEDPNFDTDTDDSIESLIIEMEMEMDIPPSGSDRVTFGEKVSDPDFSNFSQEISDASSNDDSASTESLDSPNRELIDPLEDNVVCYNEKFVCDFCKNLKEMGLINIKYVFDSKIILFNTDNLRCFVCRNLRTLDDNFRFIKTNNSNTEYIKCLKCHLNKPAVDFTTLHNNRQNTKNCIECRNKTKITSKEIKLKKQTLIKEKFLKGEIDAGLSVCVKCYELKPKDQFFSKLKKHYTVKCLKCRKFKM